MHNAIGERVGFALQRISAMTIAGAWSNLCLHATSTVAPRRFVPRTALLCSSFHVTSQSKLAPHGTTDFIRDSPN